MSPVELVELTAGQAAAAVRSGHCSSVELAEALLARAGQIEQWNAFITIQPEGVLEAARAADAAVARGDDLGLLHGVPIAVKDNIHVAGLPNTAGTPGLRDFVPLQNAPVVDRLVAAGAIVLGKTNMHELAFGITSNNTAYGPVGCAYSVEHLAGGSSGGTATAVALRAAPAGLGTDTGGSLRIPAAHNGIVSLRPTTGRYPVGGVTPLSSTRDTSGPMTRSVADLLLIDGVVTGALETYEMSPPDLRIGFDPAMLDDVDDAVAHATTSFVGLLRQAGFSVVDVPIVGLSAANELVSLPVVLYEAKHELTEYLTDNGIDLSLEALAASISSPDVHAAFEAAIVGTGVIDHETYADAITRHRPALQRLYAEHFDDRRLDATVAPTTPLTAPARLGTDRTVMLNGREVGTFDTYIRFTDPSSNAGVPSVCLPIGIDDRGLPIGIEITGRAGDDRRVMFVARRFEALLPSLAAPVVY